MGGRDLEDTRLMDPETCVSMHLYSWRGLLSHGAAARRRRGDGFSPFMSYSFARSSTWLGWMGGPGSACLLWNVVGVGLLGGVRVDRAPAPRPALTRRPTSSMDLLKINSHDGAFGLSQSGIGIQLRCKWIDFVADLLLKFRQFW